MPTSATNHHCKILIHEEAASTQHPPPPTPTLPSSQELMPETCATITTTLSEQSPSVKPVLSGMRLVFFPPAQGSFANRGALLSLQVEGMLTDLGFSMHVVVQRSSSCEKLFSQMLKEKMTHFFVSCRIQLIENVFLCAHVIRSPTCRT